MEKRSVGLQIGNDLIPNRIKKESPATEKFLDETLFFCLFVSLLLCCWLFVFSPTFTPLLFFSVFMLVLIVLVFFSV